MLAFTGAALALCVAVRESLSSMLTWPAWLDAVVTVGVLVGLGVLVLVGLGVFLQNFYLSFMAAICLFLGLFVATSPIDSMAGARAKAQAQQAVALVLAAEHALRARTGHESERIADLEQVSPQLRRLWERGGLRLSFGLGESLNARDISVTVSASNNWSDPVAVTRRLPGD